MEKLISPMDQLVLTAHKWLVGILVFLSGMFTAVLEYTVKQQAAGDNVVAAILGPLGALAFSLAVIAYLVRYLKKKEARLNKLQDDMLAQAKKDAEYWRRKALGDRDTP